MILTQSQARRFERTALRVWSMVAAMVPAAVAIAQGAAPAKEPQKTTSPAAAASTHTPARPKSDLPSAEEIQDKFIAATGGKEAYEKLTYRVYKGKLELSSQIIKGTIEVVQGPGSKFHQVLDLPGLGKVEQGSDGNFVWEYSPLIKYRLLRKSERAEALRNMNFRLELDLKSAYPMMDCVGTETVDGKEAYKVIMVSKEGVASTRYYDKESGFLVKQSQTVSTPHGNLPNEMRFEDYQETNGMKFAHRTREKIPGMKDGYEHIITVESIEYPESVDASLFELPADIKKIIARYRGEDPNAAPEDAASAVTPSEIAPPPIAGEAGSKPDPTRPQPKTPPKP